MIERPIAGIVNLGAFQSLEVRAELLRGLVRDP